MQSERLSQALLGPRRVGADIVKKAVPVLLFERRRFEPMNLRIPKMRHHKGRDQAAVVLEDGRYRYLGPWGSDEAQRNYDRLIHEWLTNGRRA